MKRIVWLLVAALAVVGCTDEPETATTEAPQEALPGATAPELAVSELFRLLGREEYADVSHLAIDSHMVVVALIEGVEADDAALLETTGTLQVSRNFWNGFRSSVQEALSADTIDLRIGEVETFEAGGSSFARVDVLFPLDGSTRSFVVAETDDGWRIDVIATFATALVPKIPEVSDDVRRQGSPGNLLDILRSLEPSLQAAATRGAEDPQIVQAVTAALEAIRR